MQEMIPNRFTISSFFLICLIFSIITGVQAKGQHKIVVYSLQPDVTPGQQRGNGKLYQYRWDVRHKNKILILLLCRIQN